MAPTRERHTNEVPPSLPPPTLRDPVRGTEAVPAVEVREWQEGVFMGMPEGGASLCQGAKSCGRLRKDGRACTAILLSCPWHFQCAICTCIVYAAYIECISYRSDGWQNMFIRIFDSIRRRGTSAHRKTYSESAKSV